MKKILALLAVLLLLSGYVGGEVMANGDKWFSQKFGTPSVPPTWLGRQLAGFPAGTPIGTPIPSYMTETAPSWDFGSKVGTKGKGTPSELEGWTPSAPSGESSWTRWMPYLKGLGIRPIEGRGWTGTSPAMRSRMQPEALQAMQDYMPTMGLNWEDYLNWTQSMMPRNPLMSQRMWRPAMSYVRRW